MFDLDAGKLIVIGIVALIAIPSKDLPRVLRQLGHMTGRVRRMAGDFQNQFMEAMREADLDDLKNLKAEVDSALVDIKREGAFDPLAEARKQIGGALELEPSDRGPPGSQDKSEPDGARSEIAPSQGAPGA